MKAAALTLGLWLACALPAPAADAYNIAAWLSSRLTPQDAPALPSTADTFRVETAAEGLQSPWAVVPAPDGRLFITERPGRLRVVEHGVLRPAPVPGVPPVAYRGQGGLLDMTLHPDYEKNRQLYLAYTVDNELGMMTRVARFEETPEGLKLLQVVFPGFPGSDKPKHFGCRIRFGADRKLYLTLGERGEGRRAQDLMDLNGKTLRLNEDGTVPADNPFSGRADARPEIFSYGNRNSQGMTVQPGTGWIFQTEHGPSWNDAPGGGDEINLIVAGGNYGWPLVHHRATREGTLPPLAEYTPAIAPAGCTFYNGERFPAWAGDFFFTNLVGKKLVRLRLDGPRVVGQEFLLENAYGRLRDVAQGADGLLFVITSDTDAYGPGRPGGDRLLRLVPRP
ncbi:MAG: PQQ-dependent sugar dehydrogenase [Desulfobacteraceae bacterium]|nr:MAG: PQQ-dependent sugar dehydrogenase [Desulfobacteraceae bacterium]